MGLRIFFLPNFPGATLIQGAMFIPDSRVNQRGVGGKTGKTSVLPGFSKKEQCGGRGSAPQGYGGLT